MGLALFKERRISERQRLTGLLPGRMVRKLDGADIAVKPIDVSRNGLGILVAKELEPGEELILMIPGSPLVLQIAWTQQDFSKNDQIRYGLVSVDPSRDIAAEFLSHGCLK